MRSARKRPSSSLTCICTTMLQNFTLRPSPGWPWRFQMSAASQSSPEPKYFSWKDVERESLNPLIEREMVYGQQIMVARVFIKKDGHVPLHHHHNEQLTYILEGALKFA